MKNAPKGSKRFDPKVPAPPLTIGAAAIRKIPGRDLTDGQRGFLVAKVPKTFPCPVDGKLAERYRLQWEKDNEGEECLAIYCRHKGCSEFEFRLRGKFDVPLDVN